MLSLLLAAVVAAAPAGSTDPKELIAILKSEATPPAEKAITCKRLAVYGNKDAIPVIAPLLADEKLASWARIALEMIPDPAAKDALRDALGKVQGRLLIGVINSLGVLRDTQAINPLADKLKGADIEVASAAAVALGKIGGHAVAQALVLRLENAPTALRPAVAEGCIRCAERYLADSKSADACTDAQLLYEVVRRANVSKQKTLEATRGSILARRVAGVPMLVELLQSPDRGLFNMGLSTARELRFPEVTKALLAELERSGPARQPFFLLALADRGDAEVLPAAIKAAKAGTPKLRLTAVNVLERLGDASALPVLLAAATESDADLAQAAKYALTKLSGAEVDAAIIAMLKQPDAHARRAAIELAGQRRLTAALPELLKAAADSDDAISTASLKVLGDIAGADEIPALLKILTSAKDTTAAETALSAVCARQSRPSSGTVVIKKAVYGDLPDGPQADVTRKVNEIIKSGTLAVEASNGNFGDTANGRVKRLRVEYTVNGIPGSRTVMENETVTFVVNAVPAAIVDPLCAALAPAPANAKLALLRILRSAGGPKALAAVRAAASDSNAEIKETAQRALCEWQTVDALPDVVQLAKTTTDKKWKILALRAQLRLIPQQETALDQKLAALKDAIALVERPEEKRLALAALGEIPTAESLALVTPYLSTAGLQEEAAIAAVAIAEKIVGKHPAEVAAAMKLVKTNNKKLANRAHQLLAQAQKAVPRK